MSATTPSLGRLLISHITLRGPELAQLYALVAERKTVSYDDLIDAFIPADARESKFGLEEAPLREALNFLLVAGLVQQIGTSRRRAMFQATTNPLDDRFNWLLLRSIAGHEDVRQQAIALVYRELVALDLIAVTPPEVRTQMERGPYHDLFTWTGEKIGLWEHLASYIGLIRRSEREELLLLVPQPDLVLAALRWSAAINVDSSSLDTLLTSIDTGGLACFTQRGRVHRGFAQTLLALERAGEIHLTHSADAARSLLLGERRVSDVRFSSER